MLENIILSLIFSGILCMTLDHAPLFVKRILNWTPAALVAAVLHFGYGGWLGGVTGHMLGAFLSVPMYFLTKYFLQPRWKKQLEVAWDSSWFNRKIVAPINSFIFRMKQKYSSRPTMHAVKDEVPAC